MPLAVQLFCGDAPSDAVRFDVEHVVRATVGAGAVEDVVHEFSQVHLISFLDFADCVWHRVGASEC